MRRPVPFDPPSLRRRHRGFRHSPAAGTISRALLPVIALLLGGSCTDSGTPASPQEEDESDGLVCTISRDELVDGGVGVDGIPALTDPQLVAADAADADFIRNRDRVVGLFLDGEPVAVPLNILWWHEVVNFDSPNPPVVVTHCPLTGSSLTFDRSTVEGVDFGVSGVLFRNNLVLFDRRDPPSLWPQMLREAACGPELRTPLPMYPSVEMTWEKWRELHPDTRVVSESTGFRRDYTVYPYGNYRVRENPDLFVSIGELDDRRPPKERVLGIPAGGDGGFAFAFGEMERRERLAISTSFQGEPVVVFWSRDAAAAVALFSRLDGDPLTFEVRDGAYRDLETGSVWRLDGLAVSGAHEGRRLDLVPEAYIAFWFAWADFQPETALVDPLR